MGGFQVGQSKQPRAVHRGLDETREHNASAFICDLRVGRETSKLLDVFLNNRHSVVSA